MKFEFLYNEKNRFITFYSNHSTRYDREVEW